MTAKCTDPREWHSFEIKAGSPNEAFRLWRAQLDDDCEFDCMWLRREFKRQIQDSGINGRVTYSDPIVQQYWFCVTNLYDWVKEGVDTEPLRDLIQWMKAIPTKKWIECPADPTEEQLVNEWSAKPADADERLSNLLGQKEEESSGAQKRPREDEGSEDEPPAKRGSTPENPIVINDDDEAPTEWPLTLLDKEARHRFMRHMYSQNPTLDHLADGVGVVQWAKNQYHLMCWAPQHSSDTQSLIDSQRARFAHIRK